MTTASFQAPVVARVPPFRSSQRMVNGAPEFNPAGASRLRLAICRSGYVARTDSVVTTAALLVSPVPPALNSKRAFPASAVTVTSMVPTPRAPFGSVTENWLDCEAPGAMGLLPGAAGSYGRWADTSVSPVVRFRTVTWSLHAADVTPVPVLASLQRTMNDAPDWRSPAGSRRRFCTRRSGYRARAEVWVTVAVLLAAVGSDSETSFR